MADSDQDVLTQKLTQYHEKGVQFVSLQNKDAAMEMANAPELGLIDFHDDLLDLADTAALIANMDLVISVDTAIAHLAGAMGKPVWVLLMKRADWRWQHGGESNHWYSSARLFRQSVQGDWGSVVRKLIPALDDYLSKTPRV